jgi:hypothetical protein
VTSRTLTLEQAAAVLKTTPETVSGAIRQLGMLATGVLPHTPPLLPARPGELARALAPGKRPRPAPQRMASLPEIKRLLDERAARVEQRAATDNHHSGKRRAAKLQRVPPWADREAIRAIYKRARDLTEQTGVPHHVDHVLPLRGKRVSGLHVHQNLQIITGAENGRKHNRFEPC